MKPYSFEQYLAGCWARARARERLQVLAQQWGGECRNRIDIFMPSGYSEPRVYHFYYKLPTTLRKNSLLALPFQTTAHPQIFNQNSKISVNVVHSAIMYVLFLYSGRIMSFSLLAHAARVEL